VRFGGSCTDGRRQSAARGLDGCKGWKARYVLNKGSVLLTLQLKPNRGAGCCVSLESVLGAHSSKDVHSYRQLPQAHHLPPTSKHKAHLLAAA
jgi:hypothetical protein